MSSEPPSSTLGLSIRMIRQYDPEKDRQPVVTLVDKAFILAMGDEREDVTFGQKLSDALTYLKRSIH